MNSRLFFLATAAAGVLSAQSRARILEPGSVLFAQVAGPEQHLYVVRPKDGDFLRIWIGKTGVDLDVGLFRRGKGEPELLFATSSASGTAGAEVLSALIKPGEEYLLTVEPSDWAARPVPGRYQVQATVRVADAKDSRALEAQKLRLEAADLADEGKRSESAAKLLQSAAVYQEIGDKERVANSWLTLGLVLTLEKNVTKALEAFGHSLPLYADLQDAPMQARVLVAMAEVLSMMGGRDQEAADTLVKAFPFLQKQSDYQWEFAEALVQFGNLQAKLGKPDGAQASFEDAVQRYVRTGDRAAAARARLELAELQSGRGDLGRALPNAEEALKTANALGEVELKKSALLTKCSIHMDLNQPALAAPLCEEGVAIAKTTQDSIMEMHLRNVLARAYAELGDKAKSAEQSKLARAVPQDLSNPYYGKMLEGLREMQTASAEFQRRNFKAALASANNAVAIFDSEQSENLQLKGKALSVLGDIYLGSGKTAEGFSTLMRALPLLRATDQLDDEARLLGVLMRVQAPRNVRAAIAFGKQAVKIQQKIRASVSALDAATQADYLRSVAAMYRTLADLLTAQGRLGEAEEVLSLLKREEYKQLVRGDVLAAAGLSLTQEEAEWQKKYDELTQDLVDLGAVRSSLQAKTGRTPDETEQLVGLRKKMEVGNAAFGQFLTRMERDFGTKDAGVAVLNTATSMMSELANLPPGTVAVYTLVTEKGVRLVLVTPQASKAYLSRIRDTELNAKVASYRQILQNPNADPRPLGQELYKVLVPADLEKDLRAAKAKTIMWSLDGALRYLPVAALHDGKAWLVESYRLSLFTPDSRGRLNNQPKASWSVAGFGVTAPHTGFAALPAVKGELESIGKLMEGSVKLDEKFTEAEFLSELDENPRKPVVHIASHFAFQPGDGTASFLLLGDGGHLTISDISNKGQIFQGVDLLTLSACNTASGGGGDGHEFEGFGMAAQKHGAEAVLASLWSVSDDSTGKLMQRFYELRQQNAGMFKAEALQTAQVELIRGNVKPANGTARDWAGPRPGSGGTSGAPALMGYSHPFYWAPFVLIGNWK